MHPKDKTPSQLHQDQGMVHQWTCPEENCNSPYIGESSRCLESMFKEHNTSATSVIFQHSSTHNHHKADISQFKIIDQDRKEVSREAKEAIHIRRNNLVFNPNIGKMNIPKIFNQILGTNNTTSTEFSTNSNIPQNPSTTCSSRTTSTVNLHN